LGTDIADWEKKLAATKSTRLKKELNDKLAKARKDLGQFEEMKKDAASSLEKLQGTAKEALAAKEKELDGKRQQIEKDRNAADTAFKTA